MIANDMISTNLALYRGERLSGGDLSPESVQYFWAAIAQFREAVKFLGGALQEPDVQQFLSALPEDAQQQLRYLEGSFRPWKGSFAEKVTKPIRDNLFHYPTLDDPIWDQAQ